MTSSSSRRLPALLDPELFRVLGEANRAAILVRLARAGRPLRVSEVASCCPVDLSVVSRHLAALRRAGLVEARRRGREVHYTPCCARLAAALRSLAGALEACCPPGAEENGDGPDEND